MTTGTFVINRQASQVRSCLPSWYAAKNHTTVVAEEEPRKSWRRSIKKWTGIANDRSQWATITAEAFVGVPNKKSPKIVGLRPPMNTQIFYWQPQLEFEST